MKLLYEESSYKLRGIFFKIYNEIGPGLQLGFLVNFGNSRLEIKRFVNEKSSYLRNQSVKLAEGARTKKSALS